MSETNEGWTLSHDDAAALDALMGDGAATGPRTEHLSALLALLDTPPAPDDGTLVDVTMARVLRERDAKDLALVPDDEEALDAWVAAGYRDARVAPSLRDRARKHEHLAALVTSGPDAGAGDDLVEATLARVQRSIDVEGERLRLDARPTPGRGLRLADVVSVAAVLLIGFSVVWPVFASIRHRGQVASCLNHFRTTASAMSAYAGTHRDQLPMATASLGGGRWWNVDPERPTSNSANLFELARGSYTDVSTLSCPGNRHAPTVMWDENARDWRSIQEVSYSYQIMFGPERPRWTPTQRAVVLTDRSPVVLRAYRGERVDPEANSPNHNGKGQHMLFTDGSAEWARSPVMEDGDNIWLPRAIERVLEGARGGRIGLEGTETPDSAMDVFVGP